MGVDYAGNLSPYYSQTYIIDKIVPIVTANPSTGIFNKDISVSLSMNKPGTIYYTTNGISPSFSSTKYTCPIIISSTKTLKYIGYDLVSQSTKIYTQYYTIDKISPTINATPTSGKYNNNQSVKLTLSEPGTIYYYTVTPSDPEPTKSFIYNGTPILINQEGITILKYVGIDKADNKSPYYTQTYNIQIPPTATANKKGGLYLNNLSESLSMNERGSIYYTTDGSIPTLNSNKYTSPIIINSSKTLKYYAVDLFGNSSPIYSQYYTIYQNPPYPINTNDKINPSVSKISGIYTSGSNSRTGIVKIYFNENIFATGIILKNLTTQQEIIVPCNITQQILQIRYSNLTKSTFYLLIIPAAAIRDQGWNSLKNEYSIKFKTSAY